MSHHDEEEESEVMKYYLLRANSQGIDKEVCGKMDNSSFDFH